MLISIVIPARNEGNRVASTIQALVQTRASTVADLEFVIVDDASNPPLDVGAERGFGSEVSVRVIRADARLGVPRARNLGAAESYGDVLVMTDAHVRFSRGWNIYAEAGLSSEPIVLAATIADPTSRFRGYGCSLVVPFMGTRWNRESAGVGTPVHVPSSAGTILSRSTFELIGGYDEGMILYGGAEPEFGLRAWLSGVPVIAIPDLLVWHRFKTRSEIDHFLADLRPAMTHNFLRFGLLYLPVDHALQMMRYHANLYPEAFQEAARLVEESDVWERRSELSSRSIHDFEWFCRTFSLVDQVGRPLYDLRIGQDALQPSKAH